MFTERKITGRLHGETQRQFSAILGVQELQEDINEFGKDNPLTALVPNVEGVDPDDAFSRVPYGISQDSPPPLKHEIRKRI